MMTDQNPPTSRLLALRDSGLLDTPSEEGFDRLTRLAIKTLGVPVALVSLVDQHRQFFKSSMGLPEPWASARETPLTHSFCQHVVTSAAPLIIADARENPLVCDNLAISDLGVMAYAGIPLVTPDGHVLGSFCVIDIKPREWSENELSILKDLAAAATSEIHLKWARDAAEAANRAKERFLAVLSHELRTPISPALMIASSLAQNESLSPEVREDAMTIQRNIAQQTRLIDDLLDVTRIEIGKLSLYSSPLDVHGILREVVAVCKGDADAKSVGLCLTKRATHPTVNGDAVRLRQIFSNLIKNAVKFTPRDGKVIVETTDGPAGSMRIAVRDNGIGVEPALLDSIFNVYEQGGRAITDEFSGLGLGLAISKGLVEAHGGAITAHSDGKGKGTTMTVELPICTVQLAKPDAPKQPIANQSSLRILLVDDHQDTLNVMARLLKMLKHRVIKADSVAAALEAAEGNEFDLLISDLGLPDGTGLDLMRELQKKGPLKGVAVTGYGMESDVEQTRHSGFIAHLTKPISLDQLIAALERASM